MSARNEICGLAALIDDLTTCLPASLAVPPPSAVALVGQRPCRFGKLHGRP
jgi:hypothetical protein